MPFCGRSKKKGELIASVSSVIAMPCDTPFPPLLIVPGTLRCAEVLAELSAPVHAY